MTSEVGMPAQQLNAHPGDELVMRIGIPHRGGRLAFHAFQNEYPAMVSASAFWNRRAGRFVIPEVAPPALIGIGSVCRRPLHHPTHGLYAILRALDGRLPAGAKAHLFGVKGAGVAGFKGLPWVASADSMAYDFTERVNAHRRGESNTIEARAQAMSRWMGKTEAAMRPGGAAQGLLAL